MNASTPTFCGLGLTLFADLPHKVRSLDAETIRLDAKELDLRFTRCTGSQLPRSIRSEAPRRRSPHHGLTAHDCTDRGFDRDARRARR